MTDKPFSVAVYCASSNKLEKSSFDDAMALGEGIAKRGWRLVYGAGSTGLMGAVARTAQAHGGKVYGVIPNFLDTLEVTYLEADELVRVETMRERKALMEINSDGFVALPGGFGTLEEVSEIIVAKQLGYLDRPLVFLNTNEFWSPLLAFFDQLFAQQFAVDGGRALYYVADTVTDALDYVANYYPAAPEPLENEEAARTAME